MRRSEKQIQEILGRSIEISDTVNERINDTYEMLYTAPKNQPAPGRCRKRSFLAAAAAAIACLIIPTAVYATANSDFLTQCLEIRQRSQLRLSQRRLITKRAAPLP